MILPYAVVAIAAVNTVVRAGEIWPGYALIRQKPTAAGDDDLDTVIAAPVVNVVEKPIAPDFSP